MSGPIVRSGPSPEFSRNWDNVFGKKSGKKAGATSATATATKKKATAPKKAAPKKKKKAGK